MDAGILILGRDGQVGGALVRLLGSRAIAPGRGEADFLKHDFIKQLEQWLAGRPVSVVINAAAYTAVDKAESEGREEAFRINSEAVGELAAWCCERQLPLVHYSTDYVFDGSGDRPWREQDTPHPVNAYGESKLAGEHALRGAGCDYLLLRTSWIYDAYGKNFFNTMLRLMGEKERLAVVSDQIGAPTYAPHLARATLSALNRAAAGDAFPSGTYHLCSGGETSWHDFASAIFALARAHGCALKCQRVDPIPTSDYPTPARRPLNSQLDCTQARQVLGVALPHWEEGLKECFKEKYAGSGLQASRA